MHRPARTVARSRDRLLVAVLCGWLVLVLAAMALLWKYKTTPGQPGNAPGEWPLSSRIEPPLDTPVLLMFAHPRCSCTRASLAELRALMSRSRNGVHAYVVFLIPDGVGSEWRNGDIHAAASSIPGVRVVDDFSGIESRRFGAATSGQVVLYGSDRRLLWSGGITAERGHVGDNAGRDRVFSLIRNQHQGRAGTPVFGCSFQDSRL
jgi:hypothetical protein